jgi:hypothetical protein
MFNNRLRLIFAAVTLGAGTWLLARQSQDSAPSSGRKSPVYSMCNTNNNSLMIDLFEGKTWMLRRLEDGRPAWLPIHKIDSEREAMHLWRKSSDFTAKADEKGQSVTIDSLLKERGHIGIPLIKLKIGYLGIGLQLEGKKVFLAVDTAAPSTHLDMERVKHLHLNWQPSVKVDGREKGKSLANQASFWCEIKKLEIGGIDVRHLVVGENDLSDINNYNKSYLDPQIDGLLGSDVLTRLGAIIDYSTLKLYIRSAESKKENGDSVNILDRQ